MLKINKIIKIGKKINIKPLSIYHFKSQAFFGELCLASWFRDWWQSLNNPKDKPYISY